MQVEHIALQKFGSMEDIDTERHARISAKIEGKARKRLLEQRQEEEERRHQERLRGPGAGSSRTLSGPHAKASKGSDAVGTSGASSDHELKGESGCGVGV